jgi:hypothetical protein
MAMIELQEHWRQILAGVLVLFVGGRQSWPWIKRQGGKVFAGLGQDDDPAPDSDAAPPEGFVEHVARVLKAAPRAHAIDQLEYLKKGLTFAQTLQAEVDRYGEEEATDES